MVLHGGCIELDYIRELLHKDLTFWFVGIFCTQLGGKYVLKSAICSYLDQFYLGCGKEMQLSAAHNRPLPRILRGTWQRIRPVETFNRSVFHDENPTRQPLGAPVHGEGMVRPQSHCGKSPGFGQEAFQLNKVDNPYDNPPTFSGGLYGTMMHYDALFFDA